MVRLQLAPGNRRVGSVPMVTPRRVTTVLKTFLAMPAPERRLLVSALGVVTATRLALTILPSRVIIRAVARLSGKRPATSLTTVRPRQRATGLDPRRITWAVERVSLRVPGATCLTQALSAHTLLSRHGHPSRICLGVARSESGDFRAHAWLESQGRIVIGADGVAKLTRLPDLPRNPRFLPSQDSA